MARNVIEDRRQRESALLEEVREARAKYAALARECVSISFDVADAPTADGTLASAQVLQRHRELRAALDEYSDTLKRFTRAVLDVK